MAVSTTYDRVCALVAAGSFLLLGCTGNETTAPDQNTTSVSTIGAGAQLDQVGHIRPTGAFRPPQKLRPLASTATVRPAGWTQEAEPDGPVFAAPRLSHSVNPEFETVAPDALQPPQLMRLPPADDGQQRQSDATDPAAEPTTSSRSVALPQLSIPSAADAPWLWRSTPASEDVYAAEPHDATENDRIDAQAQFDTDSSPSELLGSPSSANLPMRLPPLRPNTAPSERPDATEQDSAGVDLRVPVSPQDVELPTDDPLAADAPAGRSTTSLKMTDAVGRARAAVNRGVELSERKALYSARAEFGQALRLIARAVDIESGQPIQSRALTSGLRALREAQDFAPQGMETDVELSVARYVPSHRTDVLRGEDARELTAVKAQQRYHAYAQQQLVLAAGGQPVASEALVELGNVSLQLYKDEFDTLGGPTALTFYQAAVEVDGNNAKAANELGVLLAKLGQLQQARQMLLQSVMVQPTAQAWHNLSVVHRGLGETDLADRAQHESQLARRANGRQPERLVTDPRTAEPPVAADPPANQGFESAGGPSELRTRVVEVSVPNPTLAAPPSPPAQSTQQAAQKGWKRFLPRWATP